MKQHTKHKAPKVAKDGKKAKEKKARIVGAFGIQSKAGYNLMYAWVVNAHRKDFTYILKQNNRRGRLDNYAQQLFYSCFKNW